MCLFPDTPIFEGEERESLEKNEFVRPYAAITKVRLVGLLWALGEYRVRRKQPPPAVVHRAPGIKQIFSATEGVIRMIHAHNALLHFREEPFTQDEFSASVRAVVAGKNTRLTTLLFRPDDVSLW